jgi:hypothetical protein
VAKILTVALITLFSVSVAAKSKKVVVKNKRGPASVVIAPKHFKDPRAHGGSSSYGLPADLMKAFKAQQK